MYLREDIADIVKSVIKRHSLKALRTQKIKRLLVGGKFLSLYLLNIENKYIKSSARCDFRILLAKRTRGGIARIFERLLTSELLTSDQGGKNRLGHIYLSSDLEERQGCFELQRY